MQNFARQNNSVLNVYTEDDGMCSNDGLMRSLQARLRTVIFAGHGWSDATPLANGRLEPGGGIRTGPGQAPGTFKLTYPMKQDRNGNYVGDYREIPLIVASHFYIFACYPGADFAGILSRHMSRGSIAYYNNAGNDGVTWVPTLEMAAYVTAASVILNQRTQALRDANTILKAYDKQFGYADGDKLIRVYGTR